MCPLNRGAGGIPAARPARGGAAVIPALMLRAGIHRIA